MSIEQRLSRLESKNPDGEERVWYARSAKDAAAAYNQAIADGKTPGVYVISNDPTQELPLIEGCTVREWFDEISRMNIKIHDKPDRGVSRPQAAFPTTLFLPQDQ
jgi:hypothetical protein